ncbi:hypothetical protein AX15_007744 [Amanita polypyramis BW_CC]|nr:hypothetical protein AX15_007744 [Amanita polypyramis BW_CC]
MSIDLEWDKLDSSLASYVVDILNRQLANVERPSFIGPVEITSLHFGSTAPDIELVDLRDIYRDFLEDDDEESERGPGKGAGDDEGYEWVSRRAGAAAAFDMGRDELRQRLAYHHLPPHVRHSYGLSRPPDMFSSLPSLRSPLDPWSTSSPRLGTSVSDLRSPAPWHTAGQGMSHPSSPGSARRRQSLSEGVDITDFSLNGPSLLNTEPSHTTPLDHLLGDSQPRPPSSPSPSLAPPSPPTSPPPSPEQNPHPNLQLHFHVNWHSNLRITLTTSLLVNYPSPEFMSLPIKLSVSGLVFNGELAVAYEGERRRVHLCILDDMDPYGPTGDRAKRLSTSSTPSDIDDDGSVPGMATGSSKPLRVGQRLLPSIYIESEIGQADKHVLKNVTRVERFIQDVIRKTVEEELVFPNFHTIILGEG